FEERERLFEQEKWPVVVIVELLSSFDEVVGGQIARDVTLVNSLADGMHLGIKEGGVIKAGKNLAKINAKLKEIFGAEAVGIGPTVAIASNRMGAFVELKDTVLEVDPYNVTHTAQQLKEAIRIIRENPERAEEMAIN
ncbi:trehalose-6-phosphate synthase, partial [Candidatus Omnitrophota bacterium]